MKIGMQVGSYTCARVPRVRLWELRGNLRKEGTCLILEENYALQNYLLIELKVSEEKNIGKEKMNKANVFGMLIL